MNKKSEMLLTITLVNYDTVQTQNSLYLWNWSSVSYGAFWGGNKRICQTMPILLTYHNVNFFLTEIAWCPTRVAFEASVGDICREALYDSHYILTCEKRHWCRATSPHNYCTTSKMAWQHTHVALLHQWCFYIFV